MNGGFFSKLLDLILTREKDPAGYAKPHRFWTKIMRRKVIHGKPRIDHEGKKGVAGL